MKTNSKSSGTPAKRSFVITLHTSSQDLGLLYTYNSPHLILREVDEFTSAESSKMKINSWGISKE